MTREAQAPNRKVDSPGQDGRIYKSYLSRLSALAVCVLLLSLQAASAGTPLKIGYISLPPLAEMDGNRQVVGFIPDVIKEATLRENITVFWHAAEADPYGALDNGAIDLWVGPVVAGARQTVYTSEPWWSVNMELLTRAGGRITSIADLPGRQIAFHDSPPVRILAQRHLRLRGAFLHSRQTSESALALFCEGKADAVFLDHFSLERALLNRHVGCRESVLQAIPLPGVMLEIVLAARSGYSRQVVPQQVSRLLSRIEELSGEGKLNEIASRYKLGPAKFPIPDSNSGTRYWGALWLWIAVLAALGLTLFAAGFLVWQLRHATRARHRAERQMRKTALQFDRASRLAVLGSWTLDYRTQEVEWSDQAYRIFGLTPGNVKASEKLHMSLVHPEDRERFQLAKEKILASGEGQVTEHRIVLPDGSVRFVRELAEPERNRAGEMVRLIGIVQDITEFRILEEQFRQVQKLESIGRLAGGVAHDFNNLLTVINGYSDLTLEILPESEPLRENIIEIRRAGERAAALTQQLLAFSRRQIIQPKVVDINTVITDAEKMLARLVSENIEIETKLDPEVGRIKSDTGLIEQVLMNLVVNARDAMPEGGKVIVETANVDVDEEYARRHPGLTPGSYVLLGITDTGVGMDEQTKARIFEPFFTTKPKGAGTGLGLSMVYGIIKQANGWIWVYSEPGKGAAFKILFPRTNESANIFEPGAAHSEALRGGETILVVEDENDVRKLTSHILRSYGYEVLEASGGEEAIQICRHHLGALHLLITDVIMPGMSGPELADRVCMLRPKMKVLLTSGYTDNVIAPGVLAEKNLAYLPKPFAPQFLAAKVREVLGTPSHIGPQSR